MSAGYTIWTEHAADGSPFRAGRVASLACCEWVRLLVGRSLALAQVKGLGPDGEAWAYLVTGMPAREMRRQLDEEGLRLAAEGVRRDFEQLRRSIGELRGRLQSSGKAIESPEAFLRSFDLLIGLRLPTDRANWIATDEGLTIINWGLWREQDRPLLEWTDEQLAGLERQVIAELGVQPDGSVGRGAASSAAAALGQRSPRASSNAEGESAEPTEWWQDAFVAWLAAALLLVATLFFGVMWFRVRKQLHAVPPVDAATAAPATEAVPAQHPAGASSNGSPPSQPTVPGAKTVTPPATKPQDSQSPGSGAPPSVESQQTPPDHPAAPENPGVSAHA
jgi:hypothetical protein